MSNAIRNCPVRVAFRCSLAKGDEIAMHGPSPEAKIGAHPMRSCPQRLLRRIGVLTSYNSAVAIPGLRPGPGAIAGRLRALRRSQPQAVSAQPGDAPYRGALRPSRKQRSQGFRRRTLRIA